MNAKQKKIYKKCSYKIPKNKSLLLFTEEIEAKRMYNKLLKLYIKKVIK